MAADPALDRRRVYGGATIEERRAERVDRLFHAAVDLIGAEGFSALRIRALCRHAGLADRYFYEEYANLEALIAAVYRRIMGEVIDATLAAVPPPGQFPPEVEARRVLTAFVTATTANRHRARIQLLEVVGVSAEMETLRRSTIHRFARLLADGLRGRHLDDPTIDLDRTALALVGGVNELLVEWIAVPGSLTTDDVIDTSTCLFVRAVGAQDPI